MPSTEFGKRIIDGVSLMVYIAKGVNAIVGPTCEIHVHKLYARVYYLSVIVFIIRWQNFICREFFQF